MHSLRLPDWVSALGDLILPRSCAGCKQALLPEEQFLCPSCLSRLPRTGFSNFPQTNEVFRKFAAEYAISGASANYFFEGDGILQHVVHTLKYSYRPSLGVFLGRLMAHETGKAFASGVDAIIPVPLHPAKFAKRGYNQATQLAKGLSEAWDVPVVTDLVRRTRATDSQTAKNRDERFSNMQEAFTARASHYRHILVVDDVVTTGATLSGVLSALQAAGYPSYCVLTLAVAT